jgi:transcriptional regulator GlxA family with amidase domain
MAPSRIRRIAFLAFPRITFLDLIGPYDALRRVARMGVDPDVTHAFIGVGTKDGPLIADESGLHVRMDAMYAPLDDFDLLVVPGGNGTRPLMHEPHVLDYLRGWGHERPIASVCTGSLLLGASGHLEGLPATTHFASFEELRPYVTEVRDERVVDAGRVITAGGVCAGLDLGLHLVERFWGEAARAGIARQMNYVAPASLAAPQT